MTDMSWMLQLLDIHIGDRLLDVQALRQIINVSLDPLIAWAYARTPCRKTVHNKDERDSLIKDARTIFVKPQDRRSESYVCDVVNEQIDFGKLLLDGCRCRCECRCGDSHNSRTTTCTASTTSRTVKNNEEFAFRHPGTFSNSEDEQTTRTRARTHTRIDSHNSSDRYTCTCTCTCTCNSKDFSPIATKAAQLLYGIDLVGPNGLARCSLRPVFPMQMAVRVDDHRRVLYYDCIEYKPTPIEVEQSPLPTPRQITKFRQTLHLEENSMYHSYIDEDQSDDETRNDTLLDLPVSLRSDFPEDERIGLHFQAISAAYLNSRVFRLRLPLSFVVGILLRSTATNTTCIPPEDSRYSPAVLILELSRPPTTIRNGNDNDNDNTFAVRRVGSKNHSDNKFIRTQDWTPNAVASKATRHYIYGALYEIKELAAHLCNIDPRIASMMTQPSTTCTTIQEQLPVPRSPSSLSPQSTNRKAKRQKTRQPLDEEVLKPDIRVANTLSQVKCAILGYSASPDITSPHLPILHRNGGLSSNETNNNNNNNNNTKNTSNNSRPMPGRVITENKMTEALVNDHLVASGLVSQANVNDVNVCLKAGIQNGFIALTKDTTNDTTLIEGKCCACNNDLIGTFGNALFQTTYPRTDHEEGDESGVVRCNNEHCGVKNYVTSLCNDQPQFSSALFHNHCTECPGFGTCTFDYRNTHCSSCGEHYFRDSSIFECEHCGVSKDLRSMNQAVPSLGTWDGKIEGLDQMVTRKRSDIDTNRTMMLLSSLGLQRDPGYDGNSSEENPH